MSAAGGVQDAKSHLPSLPCLRAAGYRTLCPVRLAPFGVIPNVHPVITLWAAEVQDAESHLPPLPCLRPAGYKTLSPIHPPAMVSSV